MKQQLLDDPSFNLGSDYTERYNAVFKGGLRIYTTLDPVMQYKAIADRNSTLPNGDPNGLFTIAGTRQDTAVVCPALNDGDGHCLGTVRPARAAARARDRRTRSRAGVECRHMGSDRRDRARRQSAAPQRGTGPTQS